MRIEEYELVIGKLVLLKSFTTQSHYEAIDELIEVFTSEYVERRTNGELDN